MVRFSFITRSSAVYLISILLKNVESSQRVDPLVQTTVGLIRGIREANYSMFLGIPYAKVDEDNPFGASQPYPKFETIFDANDDSAECPQNAGRGDSPVGTLDCLRLNIYVPNSAHSGNLLPVLVWIHGGAFVQGSGGKDEFGPKFLVQHDIILVTLNYRLGIYGFMCLDDPKVPGNQGLKDQRSALRWVKENIKAFGGDADKITLSGESAGSASVDLHLLSDKEKFFSKVILQSGTSLSPWVVTAPDYESPIELAIHMGLDTATVNDAQRSIALEYLAQQRPDNIIKAVNALGLQFTPCIEKEFEGVHSLLTNDPKQLEVKSKDTPILIGSNDDECLYLYAHEDMENLGNIFNYRLENFYDLKEDLAEIEGILRHFYIGDHKINNDVKAALIDFESDFNFLHPIETSIKKYNQQGAKVYRYVFSYNGERNYLRHKFNLTIGGASHADELGYLFDMKIFNQKPNQQDQLMIDRITTLWANFVKHGDPTFDGISELLPVIWPPTTENEMPYLVLDSEMSIKDRPFKTRMAFWNLFYEYLTLTKPDSG